MSEVKKVRTACRQCHGGCGVVAQVKDGRVIKVEGDPESPISRGTLCSKGLSVTQLAYHPDRILHPMRKTPQGWERITWEEPEEKRYEGGFDLVRRRFRADQREHLCRIQPELSGGYSEESVVCVSCRERERCNGRSLSV